MPGITFSNDDLLRSKQLDASWYKIKLAACSEGPGTKDPTSTTFTCDFNVTGPTNAGVPLRHWFSEKRLDAAVGFISSFGEVKPGMDVGETLQKLVGRECLGFCAYEPGGEFPGNKIKDFRKLDK